MQLIAVPFTPTYAEYIFLKGRRVLADQMQYLLAHFPRSSPLHAAYPRLDELRSRRRSAGVAWSHLIDASVYVFRAYYSMPPDMRGCRGQSGACAVWLRALPR